MAREQQNTATKRTSPLLWLILILLLLGSTVGGVSAYLSASSNELKNEFQVDKPPTVTVTDNSITVEDPGYAVYLRAAVVVNWKSTTTGNLLAEIPQEGEGKDYTLTAGDGWFKHSDGFYYYKGVIDNGISETIPITLTTISSKDGYALTIQIAAQTVQAVGTTDGADPIDAVVDAWGITAGQILGSP